MNHLCSKCQDVLLSDDQVVDDLLKDLGFDDEPSKEEDDDSYEGVDSKPLNVSTSKLSSQRSASGPSSGQTRQPMQEQ